MIVLLLGCVSSAVCSNNITYTRKDSLKVVSLLKKGAEQPSGSCLTLYYAKQFIGTPYVGATLEVNQTEQLIVNLHQLDCTTLVESVTALTLATKHNEATWQGFCKWIKAIRYNCGKLNGYTSRNHYFSQWINSNEKLGICLEITKDSFPWTATQQLKLNFMSTHSQLYPMLKDNAENIQAIRHSEDEISGTVIRYIPESQLNATQSTLSDIHDGDILATVTTKAGLDVSHLGIAVWGKDHRLHLLNASSLHHKVILESKTLYQYLLTQKSMIGVRVIRIN